MNAGMVQRHDPGHLPWRRLIPPEHGAWGFLAAAVLIALGVAPSIPGALIAGGAVLGMVVRQAAQLALLGQTGWSTAGLLAVLPLTAWLAAGMGAPAAVPWLVAALLVTAGQMLSDAGSRRHGTLGVLTGGAALALVGGAVAAAGGGAGRAAAWPLLVAGVVLCYLLTVTPLVRARRQPTGPWRWHALIGHALALACTAYAAATGLAPILVAACFAVLAGRCLWLTRPGMRAASPKAIGLAEIPPLLLLLATTIIGVRCGW